MILLKKVKRCELLIFFICNLPKIIYGLKIFFEWYLFEQMLNIEITSRWYGMFADCQSLQQLDLSNFNTFNVTNVKLMFQNCYKLTSLNLKKFTFDNVSVSDGMFSMAKSGMNIIVGSNTAKEFISKLNTTATITVA